MFRVWGFVYLQPSCNSKGPSEDLLLLHSFSLRSLQQIFSSRQKDRQHGTVHVVELPFGARRLNKNPNPKP